MGANLEAAKEIPVDQRYRAGLTYPNPLDGTPSAPQFAATVQEADGSQLQVACPTATRLSVALMNMNAVHGSAACHWGGPSGFAEIMSAVHGLMFKGSDWRADFNFTNDAGHTENGLYALKANYRYAGVDYAQLKGFRSVASKLTGHGESHLFAEGVMVSNGPLGSSLPIAQGLAVGDRLANNQRVTICTISDGAMMEGEAKEACAAIPGLAVSDRLNPFILILSDNNTKLSGRIDSQSFTMQPSFAAMANIGWQTVVVDDGHDLQAVYSAVEQAVASAKADPSKPIFIWAKTIKGKGVKATEESGSGGHGFPLSNAAKLREFCEEINGGAIEMEPFAAWLAEIEATQAAKDAKAAKVKTASGPKKSKVQAGFPKAMNQAAADGLPVVSVSADLQGSTGVSGFHSEYPQFSFDIGIAESNMVSTAVGMSKQGYIPVVDTFAQFGVTKGNLPLTMGILSQSPVLAAFTHCGFQDAADGASHQGLYYLSATAAIPHLTQYCPATAEEAEWAMGEAIKRFADARSTGAIPDSVLFFCGRENFPVSIKPAGQEYAWGKAMVVADTSADYAKCVAISSVGYMTCYAMEAVEALAAQGIGAVLVHNAVPNRPDVATHQAVLAKTGGNLVTVEDHQVRAGAGSMLITDLAAAGVAVSTKLLGVREYFGQSAYTAGELYDKHGFGPQGIAAAATDLVG